MTCRAERKRERKRINPEELQSGRFDAIINEAVYRSICGKFIDIHLTQPELINFY